MEKLVFKDRDMFVEDILKILERGSLNDAKIKLSDGEIVANKDILMARSEYFATMFSNNKFVEGETSSVDMSYFRKAVMEKIINFLFSGEMTITQMALEQLLELTHATDMMLLTKLKEKVEDYFKDEVIVNSRKNVKFFAELIEGIKVADQYNLTDIKETITVELYFGLKKIPNDVSASDSFKTLPFYLIKDIFLYDASCLHPLQGPPTPMPTTLERTNAFMVWHSKNEVTEEQKNEIVNSFDFVDFTVEELITIIRVSGLYPAKMIDKRLLDLVKNKDLKIEEQDLKIEKLNDILEDAKKYISPFYRHRFESI